MDSDKEDARLAALDSYDVLDTEPEQVFDDLTGLAAQICSTPIAAISLVDRNRQWFKSRVGISVSETLREHGFCPHAIAGEDLFIVQNAAADSRFSGNPFVAGEPHIRFYAGAPLISRNGEALGTLCVVDYVERDLSEQQKDALRSLGRQAMSQFDLRREIAERARTERRLRESEHRYHQLVDLSPDAIFVHSAGKIVYANPAAAQMLGAGAPERLIGRSILDFVPADYKQFIAERVARVSGGDFAPPVEEKFLRLDGTVVDVEVTGIPLVYEGEPAVQAIAHDITERKRAERAVKASEARYRLLFERMMDGFYLTTPGGEFVDMNPALVKMFGYASREEMMLVDIKKEMYFSAEERDGFLDNSIKEELDVYRMRRKDGSVIWVEENGRYIRDAAGAILYHEGILRDVTERRLAEEKLVESEKQYRFVAESMPQQVWTAMPDGRLDYVNRRHVDYFNHSIENLGEIDWENKIHPDDLPRTIREWSRSVETGEPYEIEVRFKDPGGAYRWHLIRAGAMRGADGRIVKWFGTNTDVEDLKKAEENLSESEAKLRQAQKLESVGRLAGGIAHDFNNMLTAINGYSDLTLRRLKPDDPLRQNIGEIKKAGERSAQLTQQLLAFSRRQILKPKVINLNGVVAETSSLLERLIGENIRLVTRLDAELESVKADPGQLAQVIMNLAVNARDAMPRGGDLIIKTVNITVDYDFENQNIRVAPAAYVMLEVSDTGAGMTPGVQRQIFEPFFTTKPVGRGTGLGLATVYGIVKQSGGYIAVKSEVGRGTAVKIYFPPVKNKGAAEDVQFSPLQTRTASETILLVEDEEMVRNLTRRLLEESGYRVTEAQNGAQALDICRSKDCKFDLLLTDVVMPRMSGRELADEMSKIQPGVKILFTSGYTDDQVFREGIRRIDTNFIQKPFDADELLSKIREIIENDAS